MNEKEYNHLAIFKQNGGVNMNPSKNESIIELAKNFIGNCDNFEIKDLDADKQCLNNSPAITLCADYIKERFDLFTNEQEEHLIETGNNDLDSLCLFKKGMFRLFCTDEINTHLTRMVNSFIIEAINNGKRVLIISPFIDTLFDDLVLSAQKRYKQSYSNWYDDKKLYFCKYSPNDNIIELIEKIKSKIAELNIDILCLPYLESIIRNYGVELQIDTLKYLYNFAFEKEISVVSTITSYDRFDGKSDTSLLHLQCKLDVTLLKQQLPQEALYITSFSKEVASFETWDIWDTDYDVPSTTFIKSSDDFYTFDSISNSFYSNDFPF